MNPEQNNPFSNPGGTPSAGSSNPFSGGLSMSDSLASAQDNLTSAGMAANTAPGVMGLDQIGASDPSAVMSSPTDEPLVPAAPVPGSIGSVTSVPLPSSDQSVGYDPAMGAGPMPAPEIAPQTAAPYNPFVQSGMDQPMPQSNVDPNATMAQPLPSTDAAPAPQSAPAPSFDPASKTPSKKTGGFKSMLNTLSIISLITTVIFLITSIVLLLLLIDAKKNPKVVYVPQISNEESNQTLSILSCTLNGANDAREMTFSFTGDDLSAINLKYHQNFDTPETAYAMQQEVINNLSGTLTENFTTNSGVDGVTVNFEANSNDDALSHYDAVRFVYGSEDESLSTSKDDIKAHLESLGAVCIAE